MNIYVEDFPYLCEQLFSTLKIIKLKEINGQGILKISTVERIHRPNFEDVVVEVNVNVNLKKRNFPTYVCIFNIRLYSVCYVFISISFSFFFVLRFDV